MPDIPTVILARYSYTAKDGKELTFHKNDLIIVIETDAKYNNDGWWTGKNTLGKIGLFPVNFTDGMQRLKNIDDSTINDTPATTPLETPVNSESDSTPSSPAKSIYRNSEAIVVHPKKQAHSPKTFKKKKSTVKMPQHPELWSVYDVIEWLNSNNFKYTKEFTDNEISGDVLLQLTLDNLKEIGIKALGKRMQIFNQIANLKNEMNKASSEIKDQHQKDAANEESESNHKESQAFSSNHSSFSIKHENGDIQDVNPSPISSSSEEDTHSGSGSSSVSSICKNLKYPNEIPLPHVDYYPDVTKVDKLKHIDLSDHIKILELKLGIKLYKKRLCVLEKQHLYVFYNNISRYHLQIAINTKIEITSSSQHQYYLKIHQPNNEEPLTMLFEKYDLFIKWKTALLKFTIFHTDHIKSKQVEIVQTVSDALKGTNIKQPNTLIKQPDDSSDALSDIINSYSVESNRKYDFHELAVTSNKQRPYLSYVNKYTSHKGILIRDLRDIIKENVLLVFLEELSGDKLPDTYSANYHKDARYKLQIRQNLEIMKKFMQYLGIDTAEMKIDELLLGNEKQIYTLLDSIYNVFQ